MATIQIGNNTTKRVIYIEFNPNLQIETHLWEDFQQQEWQEKPKIEPLFNSLHSPTSAKPIKIKAPSIKNDIFHNIQPL